MKIFDKAVGMITNIVKYWRSPPEGKKLSYKEILCYSLGGMGTVGSGVLSSQVSIGGNLFCLMALGVPQDRISILASITTIVGLVRAPIIAWLIDNTNSKHGKFLPWIRYMTFPLCLALCAMAWAPVTLSTTGIMIYLLVVHTLLSSFQQLYATGYGGLPSVMTADASERANLLSFGSFLYSLGPSIVNALFPVMIAVIYKSTGSYSWAFRVTVPIFALVTACVGLFSLKTKERIIQPKEHKRKVPFIWGVKEVFKNGPLWLNTTSGVLAVFKTAITGITSSIAIYQLDDYAMQGLFATIIGTAYVPGMLLAPLLIKKFGKRNLIFISNFAYLLAISSIFLVGFNSIIFIVCVVYIATLIQGVQTVTGPAIGAEINDYQQYVSGERMEGFMGMITGYVMTIPTAVAPLILAYLNKSVGFNVGEDLYNHDILFATYRISLILSIASCILSTIPFFFYKLTEKKHADIIKTLEERAAQADLEAETKNSTIS